MENPQVVEPNRRPILLRIIIALLSLVFPGLGQIICGRSLRGFLFVGVVLALFIGTQVSGLMSSPTYGMMTFALYFLILLFSSFDAFRVSRFKTSRVSIGKWMYWILCAALIYFLQFSMFNIFGYKIYHIPSDGNAPALQKNDYVMAKINNPNWNTKEMRGALILFHPVGNDYEKDILFVKRIVAVEGDTFSIQNGVSYLNNTPLNESYLDKKNNQNAKDFGPVTIPAGSVFVLGDNRDQSEDSRHYGPIPVDHIRGQVLYVLFSSHDDPLQ